MSKTVVIHQPDFMPHLGFFHKFLKADQWVVLDNVQFLSGGSKSWHNRDKIKTTQGAKWLTVSVQKATLGTNINEVLLSQKTNWRANNMNLIEANYRRAPYYEEIIPFLKILYAYETTMLTDFNIKCISILMELLDVTIPAILASTLAPQGKSNELVVDILRKVEATHYLSGTGAKGYFAPMPFENAEIEVLWHKFENPIYPQLFGDFIPGLSVIDMLFNCGTRNSRKIIRGES